jgi:hypothetical protein
LRAIEFSNEVGFVKYNKKSIVSFFNEYCSKNNISKEKAVGFKYLIK